jgi:hypothetical protein
MVHAPSLSRNTPKLTPLTAPPHAPPAPAAPTPHLRSAILRKASRSTKKGILKTFSAFPRRFVSDASASLPTFTVARSIYIGGKVGILKQARGLVIVSEPDVDMRSFCLPAK